MNKSLLSEALLKHTICFLVMQIFFHNFILTWELLQLVFDKQDGINQEQHENASQGEKKWNS
jgi:hypothetical protein